MDNDNRKDNSREALPEEVKEEIGEERKEEVKEEIGEERKEEVKEETGGERKEEVKETGEENNEEVKENVGATVQTDKKQGKKWYTRIEFIIPTVIAAIFFLLFISAPTQSDVDKVEEKLKRVQNDYNEYKEEMAVYDGFTQEDLDKAKEIRKQEEEKRKKQLAEENKKGYNTGITYSQLARDPEKYKTKKVKFSGKVVQVIEGDGDVQIRFAVGGNYDMMIYGGYKSDIVSTRILEDDYITIYGRSIGTITYDSTLGGKITIPGVVIDKIDL